MPIAGDPLIPQDRQGWSRFCLEDAGVNCLLEPYLGVARCIYIILPSGNFIAIKNGPLIVDFTYYIKMVIFHSYVCVPEGMYLYTRIQWTCLHAHFF